MILKKRFIKVLSVIGAITMIIIAFATCDKTPSSNIKSVDAGSTWEVAETTTLSELSIADGATVTAPEGYNVTLTVDSVGMPIEPGTYKGKIVLTVTEEIKMGGMAMGGMPEGRMPEGEMPEGGPPGGEMPERGAPGGVMPGGMPGQSNPFKAAVYVEDGKYIAGKSVAAAVAAGEVTNTSAKDVKITSNEGYFNGIIVTGDSKSSYSIINPVINLNGNGGNDGNGLGMGIMASGKAEVSIEKAEIINNGANRSAVFVSGEGIIHVNDSYIEVNNGTIPEESSGAGMGAGFGPWLLGISGNVRATNIVESGTAYYTNTHIKSQGWGALSTDGPVKIRLYVTGCLIETVESGYGAYSIGDCLDYFSGCTFNVADYGLILCDNSSSTFTDGTVVNSGRFGVMMHTGTGGGLLTIDKGSVFNTKSAVIQIKGRGIDIVVDNAELYSEKGIIIQSMENDDPNFVYGSGSSMGAHNFSRDVNATFSNMMLNGDIINADTVASDMNVTFENATITGAITTGIVEHVLGPNGENVTMETPELYYLIGEVTNTYKAIPKDPHGVTVSLGSESKWVVDKTSYLTNLTIAEGATVTAPEGHSVKMTVDGIETPIKAGTFGGQIVLTVKEIS